MKAFVLILILQAGSNSSTTSVAVNQEFSSQTTCMKALDKLVGYIQDDNRFRTVAKVCLEK